MNNSSQRTGPMALWLRKKPVPIWKTTSSALHPVWKLRPKTDVFGRNLQIYQRI